MVIVINALCNRTFGTLNPSKLYQNDYRRVFGVVNYDPVVLISKFKMKDATFGINTITIFLGAY